MNIGARIKEARENAKMTQTELGNKIGVSGVAIMRYEKNQRQPRLDQLQQIADALEVPFYSLLIVKSTDTEFKLVQDYLGLSTVALQTLTNGIRTFPSTGYPPSDKRTLIDVLDNVLSDSTNFLTMLTYIRIATAPIPATSWAWENKGAIVGPAQFDPTEYSKLAQECLQQIIKSMSVSFISPFSSTATAETSDQSPSPPDE